MNASRLSLTKANSILTAPIRKRSIIIVMALAVSAGSRLTAASGGLDFDGANDYVTFGQAPGLGTATFTVETWFKREGTGVSMSTGSGGVTAIPLITKGCSEADGSNKDMNYFLGIRASDNVLTADFEEGAAGTTPGLNHPVAGVTPVAMNVWNHAAVTYDGSKWQLFLNGVLEAELVVGRPPRADSIQHAGLGTALNSTGTAAGYFAGVLDEVRIWNHARTASQIAATKDEQLASAPGLLGRWALDETTGTTARDTAGGNINGTLINGPLWTTGHLFMRVPTVTLVSPTNQSVVRSATVTLSAAAQDEAGLVAASLYLGRMPVSVTFKGPQQTEDTYLSADAPAVNNGSNASLTIDGASPHAHGVMRFLDLFGTDAGQVVPGSRIGSATVKVYCSNNSVSALKIYRLTESWSEAQATWNQRSSGVPWANPGADGTSSHAALELAGDCTATGWRTFDVTALVQEWSDGQPNYGFVLVDTGTDGAALASSESSTPPELTISVSADFLPTDLVPLAGTAANASVTITLPGSGEYRWNCAVTNSEGNMAWAPSDFRLTVDLDSPQEPLRAGPTNGANTVPISSTLQVQVNDPNGDAMTVSFFGRRPADAGEPFTLAVLPDTQNYSQSYPAIFTGQTQWILSNRISRNIVFVSHEGDLVNTYNVASQYQNANASLSLLDGLVPYAVLPGNHDQPSTLFNQTFPATRYEGQPWYGGHCGSTNDSSYQLFSAGGLDFVIMHLQFNPPAGVIAWADSVLKANANRRAIVTTHGFLSATGARSVDVMGSTEHLWTQLAVPNPNVFFMLCGHEAGEYNRTDYVGDRAVHQLLADYQAEANGGNGWLRLMRFVPSGNRVEVQTYSPYLGQFQTDANSQFTLDFPMTGFQLVGEVQQVPSGSLASVTWPGLSHDAEYEWYAKVTDSTGRTSVSPVWRFATGPANLPPLASAQTAVTDEDTGLNIALAGTDPDGQTLAFEIVLSPAHGVLSGSPPDVFYTPNPDYCGADSFTFRVGDGVAFSQPAAISIDVTPINDAPSAIAQNKMVNEDAPVAVTLGGTDADGDTLTFAIVAAPLHGTLGGEAPNLIYTPAANYHGPDSFTFVAGDLSLQSLPASVSIAVNPVNDPPSAEAQSITTPEDNASSIRLNATDLENDLLQYSVVAGPAHGSLSGTPPEMIYTPAANFHGADSFTFQANDGQSDSAPIAVTISVTAVNDAPVADAQTVITAEDTQVPITVSGTDADNDGLTFLLVTGPTNGVLSGEFPNLFYVPKTNAFGADSFTFRVSDGQAESAESTVSVIVTAVNDLPVAGAQTVSTTEDNEQAIELTATDAESDPLTYTVVDGPAHGTLGGTLPNLVYTPAANYHGTDSFIFQANDGQSDSAPAAVTISVTAVNDAPVADAQAVITDEDTTVPITVSGTDDDNDGLTFLLVTGPTNGVLSGELPNLLYTPAANTSGADRFEFKVRDSEADSAPAIVVIAVTPVNDAPAVPANIVAAAGFATVQLAWAPSSDVEGDSVTYRIHRGTVPGLYDAEISVAQTSWVDEGVTNGQTYYYAVAAVDASGAESGLSVEIAATPRDDRPPIISAVEATNITAGSATLIWTTDEPADSSVEVGLDSQYGQIVQDTNLVLNHSVTLSDLIAGTNYFYRVRSVDAEGNSGWSEEFTFATRPGNQMPVALGQSPTTAEDQSLEIILNATDPDNDPLSFRLISAPSHGILSGTAPALVYTPNANYHGTDTFSFSASDGQVDSALAEVQIQVVSVNDMPVAQDQSLETSEDTSLPIALTANDVEGSPLAFAVMAGPAHGTLSGSAPNLVYLPAPDYHGPDSFTFQVNDGEADSAEATIALMVKPANDAPVALEQSVSTAEDSVAPISLSASDADNDPLGFAIVSQPSHGTLSGDAPELVYAPGPNFHGVDTFTFKANDGQTDSAMVAVTINVLAVNDAPVATAQEVTITEDTAAPITVSGTDADNDSLTLVILTTPTNGVLSGDLPNLLYTPAHNASGADCFTFKVNDGSTDSAPATVTITVTAVNDPPVAGAQSVAMTEDAEQAIDLTATDVDSESLTYSIVNGPAHGTLSGTPPNLVYRSAPDYHGTDTLTFKVNDGLVDSEVLAIPITISPVNDVPAAADQNVSGPEDASQAVTLTATDADGDSLTYQITVPPLHGTLSGTPPALLYQPSTNFTGTDMFLFVASDGVAESSPAIISITVTPANDPPMATTQSMQTAEDTALPFTLTASDADGDTLTYIVVTGTTNGTLSGTAPALLYTPATNYNGGDAFTYKVSDGRTESAEVTVALTVTAINDSPVFITQSLNKTNAVANMAYTNSIAGDVTDADAGDTRTFSKVTGPSWISVTADGALLGTPASSDAGTNIISVRVTDDAGASGDATVRILVVLPNTPPVPWQLANIGAVGIAGGATYTNSVYTVKGAGAGIASTADGFYFVYQVLSADGEIKARLASVNNTSTSARAGVMIRESLTAGSRHGFMGVSPNGTFRFINRVNTGAATSTSNGGTAAFPNAWVRLVRTGNTLVGYSSTNGVAWTQVGSRSISMASQIYVGLAATSAKTNTLNTAVFDNVIVVP